MYFLEDAREIGVKWDSYLFATSLDALLQLETLWSGPHPTKEGSSPVHIARGFMGFPVRFAIQTHLVLFAAPWL